MTFGPCTPEVENPSKPAMIVREGCPPEPEGRMMEPVGDVGCG